MFAHPPSRSASRSTSLTAGLPPRRPPASIAPQPVETNVPSAAAGGPLAGLGRIARKLRVVDAGTGNFLYSRIRQDADVPHGLRQPASDSLRRPDADAVPPRKLLEKAGVRR